MKKYPPHQTTWERNRSK